MVGASAQSRDATTCTPSPTSSGLRRPTASDSGPTSSMPRATPTIVPVSVSCTAEVEAPSSVSSSGKAGR